MSGILRDIVVLRSDLVLGRCAASSGKSLSPPWFCMLLKAPLWNPIVHIRAADIGASYVGRTSHGERLLIRKTTSFQFPLQRLSDVTSIHQADICKTYVCYLRDGGG